VGLSLLGEMWENKGEVLGGLLGTAKEPTGSTLGGIWDFLTTVDPERRASIEANQEALKQRRLTPDEWGNTPNAWLYNSKFSDDPNKPSRFFKNIVPNAARFYTETSDMLQIPQDVIEPVGNLVAGGILNTGLLGEDVGLEQREMASQFGNVVVDTFKSWDNFTDAIANNPLDAMGILMGAGYSGVKIAQLAKNKGLTEKVRNTLQNFPDPAEVLGNAPLIGQFFPNTKIPIVMWHGSGHPSIQRFDTKFMGSGEGAQAYGWGVYHSLSRDGSIRYQGRDHDYEDKLVERYNKASNGQDYVQADMYENAMLHMNPENSLRRMLDEYKDQPEIHAKIKKDHADWQDIYKDAKFGDYKVYMDDSVLGLMMNDAKAIYDQPKVVQDFLRKENGAMMDVVDAYKPLQKRREKLESQIRDADTDNEVSGILGDIGSDTKKWEAELRDVIIEQDKLLANYQALGRGDMPHPTDGKGIYDYLVTREISANGIPKDALLSPRPESAVEKIISERLHENGVLGRRYPRDADVSTDENFVTFNANTSRPFENKGVPIGEAKGLEVPTGTINLGFAGDPKRVGDVNELQEGILDRFGHTIRGDDKVEIPELSIFDLEGQSFVSGMGDRTRAGGLLLDVDGLPLKSPVQMYGGQDYMWLPESVKRNLVWASADDPIKKLVNKSKQVYEETGVAPIFLPFRGKATSMDFSHQVAETMIQSALGRLNKFQIEELNDTIRAEAFFQPKNVKGEPVKPKKMIGTDYKGIDAQSPLEGTGGELRKEIIRIIDRDYRMDGGQKIKITGEGSASATQARIANADPELLDVTPMTIQNVAKIDMDNPTASYSAHPTYPVGLKGQALGKIKEDVSILDLFNSTKKDGTPYLGSDGLPMTSKNWTDYGYRKTSMDSIGGLLTNKILRNIEEGLLK